MPTVKTNSKKKQAVPNWTVIFQTERKGPFIKCKVIFRNERLLLEAAPEKLSATQITLMVMNWPASLRETWQHRSNGVPREFQRLENKLRRQVGKQEPRSINPCDENGWFWCSYSPFQADFDNVKPSLMATLAELKVDDLDIEVLRKYYAIISKNLELCLSPFAATL